MGAALHRWPGRLADHDVPELQRGLSRMGQKSGERDLDRAWPRARESRAPDHHDRVMAVLGGSLVAVVHEPGAAEHHGMGCEQLPDLGRPRDDSPANPKLGPGEPRGAADARGFHAVHGHGRDRVSARVGVPGYDVERWGRSEGPTAAAVETGWAMR